MGIETPAYEYIFYVFIFENMNTHAYEYVFLFDKRIHLLPNKIYLNNNTFTEYIINRYFNYLYEPHCYAKI